jgi:hypothetical protein
MHKTRKNHHHFKTTKKNRNVKRGGNKDEITKCKNTFIKTKKNLSLEKIKELKKMLEKQARVKFKKDKTKLNETLKRIKNFTKLDKSFDKIFDDAETRAFCNPGCKGTLLEPGNKLSERYYKDFKNSKELIEVFKKRRNEIFGKKTNVLKDSFYENAPKKYLDEIKKQGAISFCLPITKTKK